MQTCQSCGRRVPEQRARDGQRHGKNHNHPDDDDDDDDDDDMSESTVSCDDNDDIQGVGPIVIDNQ